MAELRHLIVVLGDQFDQDAAALDDFDGRVDAVWMAGVAEESSPTFSTPTTWRVMRQRPGTARAV
jgi:hypothetical protein